MTFTFGPLLDTGSEFKKYHYATTNVDNPSIRPQSKDPFPPLDYALYVDADTFPPRPVQLMWTALSAGYLSLTNSGLTWKV